MEIKVALEEERPCLPNFADSVVQPYAHVVFTVNYVIKSSIIAQQEGWPQKTPCLK